MHQHLLNAVIVNQELGQSEEEAVQTALEQFGIPENLGERMVWVWRREEQKKNTRSFWKWAFLLLAVILFDIVKRPQVISSCLPGFFLAFVLLVWWRLTPHSAPAWWAFKKQPIGLPQLLLGTAGACAWLLVCIFTASHSLMPNLLLGFFTIGAVCLKWGQWWKLQKTSTR